MEFSLFSIIGRLLLCITLVASSTSASSPKLMDEHECFLDDSILSTTTNSDPSALEYDVQKWLFWEPADQNETYVEDAIYFRFNEENLNASRADEMYSQWTVDRQRDQAWKEMGEWKLFNFDFGRAPNFECGVGFLECMHVPSLSELQTTWPGNQSRPFIRRLYFSITKYEYLHAETEALLNMEQLINARIATYASALVTTFTQQANRDRMHQCAIAMFFIDQAINMAVSVASSLVGGAISSVNLPGLSMAWSKAHFGSLSANTVTQAEDTLVTAVTQNIVSQTEKELVESELRSALKTSVEDVKSQLKTISSTHGVDTAKLLKNYQDTLTDGKSMSYDWFGLVYSQLFSWRVVQPLVQTDIHWQDMSIESGMSHGDFCGAFEGDFQDNNAANIAKFSTSLTKNFKDIRQATQNFFTWIYEGASADPGEPSLMAQMMKSRGWFGPDSSLDHLRNPQPLQAKIERGMIKEIGSQIMARDHSYMKCTHYSDAVKLCQDAQSSHARIRLSRFCPEPEHDPTLICQFGKWFFSHHQQHEREMPGISAFESLLDNEYGFTFEEFKKDVWESYKTCGNNCSSVDWGYLARGTQKEARWKIPTCVSEGVHINDFFIHEGTVNNPNARAFPSICGNFCSNETEGFMKALSLDLNSTTYKGRETLELWVDRIPRELDNLPPFHNYIALCKQGVHFPRHKEHPNHKDTPVDDLTGPAINFKYYHGRDNSCDEVIEYTADLNEYESNEWFCFSTFGRRIQKAQRDHVDMGHIPRLRLYGAAHKCKKWAWQGGGVKGHRPPHEKGAPDWKSERKSRSEKWSTSTMAGSSKHVKTRKEKTVTLTVEHVVPTTLYATVTAGRGATLVTTVFEAEETTVVETWTRDSGIQVLVPTATAMASLGSEEPESRVLFAPEDESVEDEE